MKKTIPMSATMSTDIDDARREYVVHVRVRIPLSAFEAARNVYNVDLGNVIYDAVKEGLQAAAELAPPPDVKIVSQRLEIHAAGPTTRKINLDE